MRPRNPFGDAPAWRDWLIAGLVGGVAVVGLLWVVSLGGVREDLSGAFERPTGAEAAALPRVTYGAAVVDSAPIAIRPGASSGAVVVHTCLQGGQRVYSDRPCAAGGETQEIALGAVNGYRPSAVDTTAVAVPPAAASRPPPARPSAVARDAARPDAACDSLEREIERIDARMRLGYRSQEGERLRANRHALKERMHAIGCNWPRG